MHIKCSVDVGSLSPSHAFGGKMGTPAKRLAREIPPTINRRVPNKFTNRTVTVIAPAFGSFVFL